MPHRWPRSPALQWREDLGGDGQVEAQPGRAGSADTPSPQNCEPGRPSSRGWSGPGRHGSTRAAGAGLHRGDDGGANSAAPASGSTPTHLGVGVAGAAGEQEGASADDLSRVAGQMTRAPGRSVAPWPGRSRRWSAGRRPRAGQPTSLRTGSRCATSASTARSTRSTRRLESLEAGFTASVMPWTLAGDALPPTGVQTCQSSLALPHEHAPAAEPEAPDHPHGRPGEPENSQVRTASGPYVGASSRRYSAVVWGGAQREGPVGLLVGRGNSTRAVVSWR